MQKEIIFLMVLIGFFFIASCSLIGKSNCNLYRTGDFYYHPKDSLNTFYTIHRGDSMQVEINKTTGDVSEFRITWKSPCEFEACFVKGTRYLSNFELAFYKSVVLKTIILGGTNEYYLFKSTTDMLKTTWEDTTWVSK